MGRYYLLRNGKVVEEPDYTRWIDWYQNSYDKVRRVAETKVKYGSVETVFLAVNMTLSKTTPPLLFETRVKGGWLDDEWQRYPTLEAAEAGHKTWVARVREAEEENESPPPGCHAW
jgi:hypothetical protein